MESGDREPRAAFLAGDWTIEPELNAIRQGKKQWHVEPKVMMVLLTLASRTDHVFTKEELISAVWPDTFVSEDVLTRCISILRRITGDNPQSPHFIQTVPKVGYRLVAELSELPAPPAADPDAVQNPVAAELSTSIADSLAAESILVHTSAPPAAPPEKRFGIFSSPIARWVSLALAAVLAGGILWFLLRGKTHASSAQNNPSLDITTFTSYPGEQIEPAFSPDGQSIAFVKIAEDGSSQRIYIQSLSGENARELTHDDDIQYNPAWSPDGREIAYVARSSSGLGIFIADAESIGPARRVYVPSEPGTSYWEQGSLSWSPDGKSLVFADHVGSSSSSSILRLDLDNLRAQPITSPPASWYGDLSPAYSPDGKRIAFIRGSESAVRDIYYLSVADGSLHQLTHDRKNIDSLAWSRDGASILFSSNREGKYSLWKISLAGGNQEPERLPVGTDDAFQPSTGPHPGELAYTQGSAIWSTNRIDGAPESAHRDAHGDASGSVGRVTPILSSTQQDSAPTLSPDERFFAFQSLRSGNQEIWVAAIDGSALRQLTAFDGPLTGSPSWSHSGDQILFDSRPGGHSHIFSIPVTGGRPTQITFGNANDIIPRWSIDDQTVFFRSNRGNRWQIWKVSLHGGKPQPVTTGDGIVPQESPDGKWLYYTHPDEPGLWRVSVNGGPEVKVLSQPATGYWGYFQVTAKGVYFLDRTSPRHDTIRLYEPDSGETKLIAVLPHSPPPYQGLAVGQDGRVMLITGERDAERHITLVQSPD